MRKTIRRPTVVTQGIIFNNARSEEYDSEHVSGVIINARCDLAHGKFKKLLYLPIVSFEEWTKKDCVPIAKERLIKQNKSSIRNALAQKGRATDLIDYIDLEVISERFFSSEKKMQDTISKLKLLLEGNIAENVLSEDIAKQTRLVKKDLFEFKLPGFYFIEGVDENQEHPHVVIFEEIRIFPDKYYQSMITGFIPREEDIGHNGSFNSMILTYATGEMVSPIIEHMIQQFSGMFSRIGVDDIRHDLYL